MEMIAVVATFMEGQNLKYVVFFFCLYTGVFLLSLATITTSRHVPAAAFPVEDVLEETALLPLLLGGWRAKHRPDGLIKHSFKATLSQG